jgi:hypothetical protein
MLVEIYAAFRSVPDYHAPSPPLKSLHRTLAGAIESLYPDNEHFRESFRHVSSDPDIWEGPDGFGMVKLMKVNEY